MFNKRVAAVMITAVVVNIIVFRALFESQFLPIVAGSLIIVESIIAIFVDKNTRKTSRQNVATDSS